MAKSSPAKTAPKEAEETEGVISPEAQALSYLKANKADHYNFEEEQTDITPTSSLICTAAMDGGVRPGAHRALGLAAGGKTSATLDMMLNFLRKDDGKGRRGFYVKSEGRLSPEVMARSGIKFTTDPEQWKDGVCFIFESNVFEAVFGFMGDLIRNNPTKTRYFFILDSLDMMAKRADLEKGLEDAAQVAGGALITSVFLKKTSAALAKRGHYCWFISQVRDSIKINPYEKSNPRQGMSSGGHGFWTSCRVSATTSFAKPPRTRAVKLSVTIVAFVSSRATTKSMEPRFAIRSNMGAAEEHPFGASARWQS